MGNTAGRHSPAAHFRREARVQIQTIVNVTQNSLVVLRRLTDKLSRKAMAEKDEAAWLAYEKEHGVAPTTAQYEYVWNFMPDGSDGSKFWYEKVHAPNAGRWAHPVHEIIDYGATLYPHCTPLCGVKWCSVVSGKK